MAVGAQAHDLYVGLIHVFLVNEGDVRFGAYKDVVAGRHGLHRRESFKGGAQSGLHGHGVKVTADAHNHLAADGTVVPGLQIFHRNRADGGQLGLPGVGTIGPVD